jgi:DNA topoisomerase-2
LLDSDCNFFLLLLLLLLLLFAGDSAKALAMSGLSVVGRDYYGVFPLRGKLLNVREATVKQLSQNSEYNNLKKIIGLKHGVHYEDASELRYAHVLLMCDGDADGSHIKGLCINVFHYDWPSLLKVPGFLQEFVTPIVRCTKGTQFIEFFTLPQFETWNTTIRNGEYTTKYYKGLGTSTSADAKRYFSNMSRHVINFIHVSPNDDLAIQLAYEKKQAEQRKTWIAGTVSGTFLDMDVDEVSYYDFVYQELVLYSMASNLRAIPSVIDGLKPGQRKILWTMLKNKAFKDEKVVSVGGDVIKQAAYHHGESSLHLTTVGMAQDFTGSNNWSILHPSGQFG